MSYGEGKNVKWIVSRASMVLKIVVAYFDNLHTSRKNIRVGTLVSMRIKDIQTPKIAVCCPRVAC